MSEKLEAVEKRYEELNDLMAQPEVVADFEQVERLAKEQASISDLVAKYRDYKETARTLGETRSMLGEGLDEGMATLFKEEVEVLDQRLQRLTDEIEKALIPKDPSDEKNVIVEIRAGAGGNEAGLFAADLFRMYSRYAEAKRWQVDIIDSSQSGVGGFKEITFEVKGKAVYSRLKYERGVHRVQRVPVTEASGRIHTSTATVAVLPEAEEMDLQINPDVLRIDIFRSGGHGGQSVNKVASAVRITHLPTGIVSTCQDERSQFRNKMRAMAVLRARLLDQEQRRQDDELARERRSQVGTGDRSEKIRTYNFSQGRVSDHRIGLTLHNLENILGGELDSLIDALATHDRAKRLEGQLV